MVLGIVLFVLAVLLGVFGWCLLRIAADADRRMAGERDADGVGIPQTGQEKNHG